MAWQGNRHADPGKQLPESVTRDPGGPPPRARRSKRDGIADMTRAQLNDLATDMGLVPEDYPNKAAIIDAINQQFTG